TKVHRDKVASYIDAGEAAGATIVVDGRQVQADGGKDGFWLGPTLIDHVTTDMSVYTCEVETTRFLSRRCFRSNGERSGSLDGMTCSVGDDGWEAAARSGAQVGVAVVGVGVE
ncbi:aldehyde dehydrogenase family protein, partial [Rhodococcus sp. T2V]|uniref:aldehyde dehydrogenase family protein n=1 Tax=Rhodococcus sp. T2V TaxID=3034164 RepID=UPI0023E187F9